MILPWYAPVQCPTCTAALVHPQLPYYALNMQSTTADSSNVTVRWPTRAERLQHADDEIRREQEAAADQAALGE